ncbi:hypothetical protein BH23ACT2_BH23ACT2_06220 [soil metagenome]
MASDLVFGPALASGLSGNGGWPDADTVSSLAYLAAGAAIAQGVRRGRLPRAAVTLAVATALEGVGSAWYHGGSGYGAQALHDLPLIAVMGYLGGWQVGRLRGPRVGGAGRRGVPDQGALAGTVVAVTVGGALWALSPRAVNAVVALGVVTVGVAEVVARFRRLLPVWDWRLLGLAAVSLGFWMIDWSDAEALSFGSRLAPHALWHVGTALMIAWWADRAAPAPRRSA